MEDKNCGMMENPVLRRQSVRRLCRSGFTLIELLIVVAIISILAAIALPNLLEAQVRAKVSRVKADMASLATAIEAYSVDYNTYPRGRTPSGASQQYNLVPLSSRISCLTTPVAFITSLPPEVFPPSVGWNGWTPSPGPHDLTRNSFDTYDYFDAKSDEDEDKHAVDSTRGCAWRLASSGPDRWPSFGIIYKTPPVGEYQGFDYDPTNGSISNGDLVRVGPGIRSWTMESALHVRQTKHP